MYQLLSCKYEPLTWATGIQASFSSLCVSTPGLACGGWCNACSDSSFSDCCVHCCPQVCSAPQDHTSADGWCTLHIWLPPLGLEKLLDNLERQLLSRSVSASESFFFPLSNMKTSEKFYSFQAEKSKLSPNQFWKCMFCNRLFELRFP